MWSTFLILVLATSIHAFFPTEWRERYFGKDGLTHETQTIVAYDVLAVKYFPGIEPFTKTMLKAREAIADANAEVDEDQDHSANHFDGESIGPGMARLVDFKLAIVDALNNFDGIVARNLLGQALHTLQDFYAHTNWIELGNTEINRLLGHERTQPYAAFSEATCGDCRFNFYGQCKDCRNNTIATKLTSGYYGGEDSPGPGVDIPDYKCRHGGVLDNPYTTPGNVVFGDIRPGINKDSGNCYWSPHSHLHDAAADLAIKATIQYFEDIIALCDNFSKVKLLFGLGGTMAFAIDTTGSMSYIINQARQQALAIAKKRVGTRDEASTYIIAPFNDPTTGPVTRTSDINEFERQLSSLYASGGGDCPELAMTGMLDALTFMEGTGDLFVMTDAAPKDYDLVDQVNLMAKKKGVKIHLLKFDSSCDGEAFKRQLTVDGVYGDIAANTGGTYHSLRASEVENLSNMLDATTKVDNTAILRIEDTAGAEKAYKVPVDSQMSQLSISIRGLGVTSRISKPDGSELDLTATGVTKTTLRDGTYITIQSPITGLWTVTIQGSGSFFLDAAGVTTLHFTSFNFVALKGRPGHEGYFPIKTEPAYDHKVAAVAVIDGPSSSIKFDLRRPAGDIAVDVTMTPSSAKNGRPKGSSFYGEVQLVAGTLYAYASGVDGNGSPFQRLISAAFSPVISGETNTGFNDTNPFEGYDATTLTTSNIVTTTPATSSSSLTTTSVTTTARVTTSSSISSSSTIKISTSVSGSKTTTTKSTSSSNKPSTKTTVKTTPKTTTKSSTTMSKTTAKTTTKSTTRITSKTTARRTTTSTGYPHTCKTGVVYTHSEYATKSNGMRLAGSNPNYPASSTTVVRLTSSSSVPAKATTLKF